MHTLMRTLMRDTEVPHHSYFSLQFFVKETEAFISLHRKTQQQQQQQQRP